MMRGDKRATGTCTIHATRNWLLSVTLIATALAAVLTGCDQDQIQSYRAPKDPPPAARAGTRQPAAAVGQRRRMDWTVPQGWRTSNKESPMRVATFEAGDGPQQIEIAVSMFPGETGGLLANVNRWRGQLGLDPIEEDQLIEHLTPFANTGVRGVTLDMTGPGGEPTADQPAQRMIAAIIYDEQGFMWFVKTMADPGVLSQYKDQVVAFAGSFHLHSDDEPPHAQPPTPAPDSASQEIAWQTPPDWQQDPSPASFLIAAFDVNTPSGTARVTVSSLPGDGGGALANINRWRGQVGLGAIASLDEQKIDRLYVSGHPAALIDLAPDQDNGDQARRMLVSMVTRPDAVWFFKLTGPAAAVADQQDAFKQFLSTVGFNER